MNRLALLQLLPLLCPVSLLGQDLGGMYVFRSPQGPVTLELQQEGGQLTGVMTGVDGSLNRLEGTFDGQKATGTITTNNGAGWFAVGFLEGGLTLLVAEVGPTGEPDLENGWRLDFVRADVATAGGGDAAGMSASGVGAASPPANGSAASQPPASSPLVQEWMGHLRGKKVSYVDSYSSNDVGGVGGFSDRWEAYLCSDGSFRYRGRSSMSADVGGAWGAASGGDSFTGTWRIIEQGGQAILQYQRGDLAGTDQGQWVALAYRDGATYFDGTRVYVTADNDLCR